MSRIRLVLLLAAACIAMGSCASPTSRGGSTSSSSSTVNLSGYPQEFKQGYSDGCASVQGPRARDENRFKSDPQYAQGWRDGYDICRRKP